MPSKYEFPARTIGVAEDRTRDQYSVQILYHPAGEPGRVYLAQVLANVREDSMEDLWKRVRDFTWQLDER